MLQALILLTVLLPPRFACCRAILNAVPEVFVGQATQLMYLTRLLCSELARNFEAQGQVRRGFTLLGLTPCKK